MAAGTPRGVLRVVPALVSEVDVRTGITAAQGEMTLTGERTLPGIPDENYWFRRHEAAYRAASSWVRGARLLEAGAGEGYGADLLRRSGAGPVVALDCDPSAVAHAARKYPAATVVRSDLQRLPFADGAFDAVVHLQTIEHLHDQRGFLAECARVLRPAGTLIVSTPNRLTFPRYHDRPVNPFHTRELSAAELAALLRPRFASVRMYGVHHGRRLRRIERRVGKVVAEQLASAPEEWAAGLRPAVHRVRANDFEVNDRAIDASLDLLAIARRRSPPAPVAARSVVGHRDGPSAGKPGHDRRHGRRTDATR